MKAQRRARPFVAVFLAVIVICALASWNAWPFSNWELFSRLRTDRQTAWAAAIVGPAGNERGFSIATVAHGYRGFPFIMRTFSTRPRAERDAICAAWLQGAREAFGAGTKLVRIYRLELVLSDRRGERAAPPVHSLAWTCGPGGARAAA